MARTYAATAGAPQSDPPADYDTLYADILRRFPETVAELGGDAEALLAELAIDPQAADGAGCGYRQAIDLIERAAVALGRPDFGLRLAMGQGGAPFGPLSAVMQTARTLGDALAYVGSHTYAHSLAVRVGIARHETSQSIFVGHHILLDGLPNRAQAIEQFMLLGHLGAGALTGGQARVRRVLFRHRPLSAPEVYRRAFGCDVLFDQQVDGVVFTERDMACEVVSSDAGAHARALARIEREFAQVTPPMHAQVRGLVQQHIGTDLSGNEAVAAELNLHPRTLHRRLRAEGQSFQRIKDGVRRDLALYYLRQTTVDINRIAGKLGYAEQSELSRSCLRWFATSPTGVRARADRTGRAAWLS